jgi:hypothetical protein
MSHRSSHTHCQAAQAQAWQRVCLPLPREKCKAFTNTFKNQINNVSNFKIFLPLFTEKIKTLQHTSDTDRKENDTNDKFNMKEQFDSNSRTDKNRQCITGGIFYCRGSAGFSVSASNKLSCNLTGQCSEIGNKNIPPKPLCAMPRNNKPSWDLK